MAYKRFFRYSICKLFMGLADAARILVNNATLMDAVTKAGITAAHFRITMPQFTEFGQQSKTN